MPNRLSAAEARAAFDELATELPKQHLRFQFRKRFGTGELLGPEMMKRGTVTAERARPLTNLMQEVPPKLDCVRVGGTADAPVGVKWSGAAEGAIGDFLSAEEVEQGLLIKGRTAKLYVYADPTEETVYVLRVAMEAEYEERPKPKLSRTRRAGKAIARSGRRR